MRIGNYDSGLNITLTMEEFAIVQSRRISVQFGIEAPAKEWVRITADAQGSYALSQRGIDGIPETRIRNPAQQAMPRFGIEVVAAWSPGKGILFGAKPTMARPVIERHNSGPRSAARRRMPDDPTVEHVSQAVRLINNFKAARPEEVELEIRDGALVVRMMIEFGK